MTQELLNALEMVGKGYPTSKIRSTKPKFHGILLISYKGYTKDQLTLQSILLENLGLSQKFTKILITFDSEGVRRCPLVQNYVEFHQQSISSTFRGIPDDLRVRILKNLIFFTPCQNFVMVIEEPPARLLQV